MSSSSVHSPFLYWLLPSILLSKRSEEKWSEERECDLDGLCLTYFIVVYGNSTFNVEKINIPHQPIKTNLKFFNIKGYFYDGWNINKNIKAQRKKKAMRTNKKNILKKNLNDK